MSHITEYKKNEIFFVALFLVLFFSCNTYAEGKGEGAEPPAVIVADIGLKEVNPPEEYVGHVESVQSVDLMARVKGFIEKIHFKEGDMVEAGDLLYTIEQAPYIAQVAVDEARLAKEKAILKEAEQYLKRMQAVRPDAVSANAIETAIYGHMEAKAAVQEAQALLDQSKLDLDYTVVKAPISGRIGKTSFYKGSFVGPDSGPLARIVQIDPVRVLFSISENRLPEIMNEISGSRSGLSNELKMFDLKFSNGNIYPYSGKKDFIDNHVDVKTGTIAVWILFDNQDLLLLPGQYVSLLVRKQKQDKLPVVPQAAVLEDSRGSFVFLVDADNRIQRRSIITGADLGIEWVVEKGLAGGEKIVVEGVQKVRPGQVVKPVYSAN